jgi:hypothetical protein
MTIKQSLENRIRGWFPKEPYLGSRIVKVNNEPKQPPLVIPQWSNTSATTRAASFAIAWLFMSGLFVLMKSSEFDPPIPVFDAFSVLGGLAVGAIYGFFSTRKEVKSLSRNYQYRPNGKYIALTIILIFVFFILFSLLIFAKQYSEIMPLVSNGLLLCAYPFGVSMLTIRYVWFSIFEKRENMRLMQSDFGTIFAIPKPPEIPPGICRQS